MEAFLFDTIARCENIFVGHNVSYDMAVICAAYPNLLPAVFRAYEGDRVTDTRVRQKLLDIAGGVYRGRLVGKNVWVKHEYTLEALAKRCAGMQLKKEGFRLFYGPFQGVPLSGWAEHAARLQARGRAYQAGAEDPELEEIRCIIADDKKFAAELAGMIAADPAEVTSYPLDDARATLAVYEAQEVHASYLKDQYRQARAEWALHLSSCWGIRTIKGRVDELRAVTQVAFDNLERDLKVIGLVKPTGVRDTKAAKARMIEVCRAEGLPIRRTAAHSDPEAKCGGREECDEHVSLDEDACNASGDDVLMQYAELSTRKKVLTNDVEMLEKGTVFPVQTRYDMAESGRTVSAKPNIQNLRRLPGVREAFVPRPGKVFIAVDFPSLELYTLAQCCKTWLGESKLREAINAGLDPHLAMAAQMMGITYTEASLRYGRCEAGLRQPGDQDVADMRQLAKIANFGFPGGMGAPKLVVSAKKQLSEKPELLARLDISIERMMWLKQQWYATWPEMPHYFARINALCDNDSGRASVESLFTERIRGGATYCAACNNGFQALGADCAKTAMWLIAKAQYAEPDSPLFNSRTVAFVHDEVIGETDEGDRAHDAAFELARLMVVGANTYLPDVPMRVERMKPLIMARWSKKATQVLKEGRLIPWQ